MIRGLGRGSRAARRLAGRLRGGGVILLYHRVAEPLADPWSLAVTPGHFTEHLDVLSRSCRPLALADLARAVTAGKVPRRAVAVTFDDGYADNLGAARPVLESRGVPATVFVAAGELGRELWWDELARLLLAPGTLPPELRLEDPMTGGPEAPSAREGHHLRGGSPGSPEAWPLIWSLGAAARYGEAEVLRHRGWRVPEAPPTPRHALYLALWERLRPLPPAARRAALDRLARWAGGAGGPGDAGPGRAPAGGSGIGEVDHVGDDRGDRIDFGDRVGGGEDGGGRGDGIGCIGGGRTLSPEEIIALARGGQVEVGAHTLTHPRLAILPAAAQCHEIEGSKARLEEVLGHPVTTFSYPYGGRSDYTAETVSLVRAAGFSSACSNVPGTLRAGMDLFELPRLYVRDCDGDGLARRLAEVG